MALPNNHDFIKFINFVLFVQPHEYITCMKVLCWTVYMKRHLYKTGPDIPTKRKWVFSWSGIFMFIRPQTLMDSRILLITTYTFYTVCWSSLGIWSIWLAHNQHIVGIGRRPSGDPSKTSSGLKYWSAIRCRWLLLATGRQLVGDVWWWLNSTFCGIWTTTQQYYN